MEDIHGGIVLKGLTPNIWVSFYGKASDERNVNISQICRFVYLDKQSRDVTNHVMVHRFASVLIECN
jgi:hypothetical protein